MNQHMPATKSTVLKAKQFLFFTVSLSHICIEDNFMHRIHLKIQISQPYFLPPKPPKIFAILSTYAIIHRSQTHAKTRSLINQSRQTCTVGDPDFFNSGGKK